MTKNSTDKLLIPNFMFFIFSYLYIECSFLHTDCTISWVRKTLLKIWHMNQNWNHSFSLCFYLDCFFSLGLCGMEWNCWRFMRNTTVTSNQWILYGIISLWLCYGCTEMPQSLNLLPRVLKYQAWLTEDWRWIKHQICNSFESLRNLTDCPATLEMLETHFTALNVCCPATLSLPLSILNKCLQFFTVPVFCWYLSVVFPVPPSICISWFFKETVDHKYSFIVHKNEEMKKK